MISDGIGRSSSSAAVAVGAIWAATTQAQTSEDLLRLAYFTMLGGLLLATTWFQAWYVVWPFAIGAALAEPRRHLEVALLSLGGLLQYFVFIYLWVMGFFPPNENLAVQIAAYLCIVAPLLLSLLPPSFRRDPKQSSSAAAHSFCEAVCCWKATPVPPHSFYGILDPKAAGSTFLA